MRLLYIVILVLMSSFLYGSEHYKQYSYEYKKHDHKELEIYSYLYIPYWQQEEPSSHLYFRIIPNEPHRLRPYIPIDPSKKTEPSKVEPPKKQPTYVDKEIAKLATFHEKTLYDGTESITNLRATLTKLKQIYAITKDGMSYTERQIKAGEIKYLKEYLAQYGIPDLEMIQRQLPIQETVGYYRCLVNKDGINPKIKEAALRHLQKRKSYESFLEQEKITAEYEAQSIEQQNEIDKLPTYNENTLTTEVLSLLHNKSHGIQQQCAQWFDIIQNDGVTVDTYQAYISSIIQKLQIPTLQKSQEVPALTDSFIAGFKEGFDPIGFVKSIPGLAIDISKGIYAIIDYHRTRSEEDKEKDVVEFFRSRSQLIPELKQHVADMRQEDVLQAIGFIAGQMASAKAVHSSIQLAVESAKNLTLVDNLKKTRESVAHVIEKFKGNFYNPEKKLMLYTAENIKVEILQNMPEKIIESNILSELAKETNKLAIHQEWFELADKVEKSLPKTKPGSIIPSNITKYLTYEKDTEATYELIRTTNDVELIAKNTGLPQKMIARIKSHIFYEEHVLDNGIMRFPADGDMAMAWKRLQENNILACDVMLLKHELAESILIKETGNAREAHDITDKLYNWVQSYK